MSTSLTSGSCIGFAERHRATTAVLAVLALVVVGVVSGEVIGWVLVQVLDLLLSQVGGEVPR